MPAADKGTGGRVPPPPSDEDLLSVVEVAAMTRSSRKTVYKLIRSGQLKAVDFGGLKIPRPVLREFIATQSATSTAATVKVAETE